MIQGVDLASYQGAPNFDAMRGSGIEFAITKVTEGTSYAFPGHKRNRSEARRTGMAAGLYHFARAGDPASEARFFLSAAGPLIDGEFICLDWEVGYSDPVAWCGAFLSSVRAATGLRGFVYLNESTVRRYDWSPIVQGLYPLWLAKYDGRPETLTVPHWGQPAIKQYTDAGHVPGINGNVDRNVFFGDIGQLRRYGSPVAGPPAPLPAGPETLPALEYGQTSEAVKSLQKWLNRYDWRPALPVLPVTGYYGDQTTAVVKGAQRQCGILDGDGRNIGPKTRAAFYARGWRV